MCTVTENKESAYHGCTVLHGSDWDQIHCGQWCFPLSLTPSWHQFYLILLPPMPKAQEGIGGRPVKTSNYLSHHPQLSKSQINQWEILGCLFLGAWHQSESWCCPSAAQEGSCWLRLGGKIVLYCRCSDLRNSCWCPECHRQPKSDAN
jgi:hypothetical protein